MDARRRLVERILGLRLDSKTYVKDFVTQNDEIYGTTSGAIRNAQVVGKPYYETDGTCTIRMRLKLYNVYMYLRQRKIYYK